MTHDKHDDLCAYSHCDTEWAELAAKVERMKAIIDRLPKLACGAVPYPGLEVYSPHADGTAICGPWTVIDVRSAGCYVRQSPGTGILRGFDELFGTYDAAEAARKAAEKAREA